MRQAIVYARFSKADQATGHSIDRQIENIRAVCHSHGYEVADDRTFVERGKSAFSGANRAKGSLLSQIESEIAADVHDGRVIVVEHLDRISRQGYDEIYDFIRACSDHGVSVHTHDGDTLYPAGSRPDLVRIVQIFTRAEMAWDESSKKSRRVRAALDAARERAERGEGIMSASRTPSWIRKTGDKFELIEERANIVREAMRLAELGHGHSAIAKILNERRIAPWKEESGGWQASYVQRMLTQRTVIGEYVSPRHGTRIVNYYPAVVDVDLYNRVQAARLSRKSHSSGRRGQTQSNILQNIAKCECGATMTFGKTRRVGERVRRTHRSGNSGTIKIGVEASYLRCAHRARKFAKNGQLCENTKTVRYEYLEKAVLDQLLTVALDNDRMNAPEQSQARIALAEADRNLEAKKLQAERLAQNLAETVSPTLMAMLTRIEDEIATLTVERDHHAKILVREAGAQPSSAVLARIRATREAMSSPDVEVRRDARTLVSASLKSIVTDMWSDRHGVTTVVVAHGLAAFQVDAKGQVIWRHDATGADPIPAGLVEGAFAGNAARVHKLVERGQARQKT